MAHYVYILLCEDGSYYTGYARGVEQRFEQHKKGVGARYTRMHPPERIVYVEELDSRSEALKRELEIKSLTHSEKRRFVSSHEEEDFK